MGLARVAWPGSRLPISRPPTEKFAVQYTLAHLPGLERAECRSARPWSRIDVDLDSGTLGAPPDPEWDPFVGPAVPDHGLPEGLTYDRAPARQSGPSREELVTLWLYSVTSP